MTDQFRIAVRHPMQFEALSSVTISDMGCLLIRQAVVARSIRQRFLIQLIGFNLRRQRWLV